MLNIAVFLGELQLDSQRKVLEGIMEGAKRDGNNIFVYSLTLTLDRNFNKGEYCVAESDDFSMFDGFIVYAESIYSVEVRNAIIKKVCSYDKPVASIDFPIEGVINISSNNEKAMRELSRHLIDKHGIRTANFIGGPNDSIDAIIRRRAFCEEMERSNIGIDARRFYVGDYYARSGRNAVEYFEREGLLDADVYVCANDQMALGAFYALSDRGIKVPEDVLMTGYDDIFEVANHYPRITSVTRFEEKIGLTAYEHVIDSIGKKDFSKKVEVNSQVVFAESCGCSEVRPISHRVVVNMYVAKELNEIRYAEMTSDFSAEVTSVQTYDEMCEKLKEYIPNLGGEQYAACFYAENNDVNSIKQSVLYKNGEFTTIPDKVSNDKTRILDAGNGGNLFVINSIHFGSKCYGFTIIRNSVMPTRSEFYKIFAINLGGSIEHINNYAKMQEMIKTLDEMWVYDPMTRIYNRAGFFKFADELLLDAKRNKENLFLIFLDLDGLKKVNDALGHEMGDKLICEMADILKECRSKDELVMRYGGDEFVVFGAGYEEAYVENYVNRIREAMNARNNHEGREYRIDASIGYSMVHYDDERPISAVIELADQKMYMEKREKHKMEREELRKKQGILQ